VALERICHFTQDLLQKSIHNGINKFYVVTGLNKIRAFDACVQFTGLQRTTYHLPHILPVDTVEPRFTNSSVNEQILRAKTSRMTNGVSDYEHASWQQRLATSWEYRPGSVSCWLTLAQYTSLLEFAVPSLEFHCVLYFFNILLNKTPWNQRRIMNKESLAARACTILRTGLLTCLT
jgi:hypothetical protein